MIRLGGLIYSFRMFLTIEHVPRSTDFAFLCMYWDASLFKLCNSEFGITAVDVFWKGAERAPSLRVLSSQLPYN
jgi:hypothetical protein